MSALAIYLAIGCGLLVTMWSIVKPQTPSEWLWPLFYVLLWPLLLAFAIYMAVNDRGY
jgi:hypothetical protein